MDTEEDCLYCRALKSGAPTVPLDSLSYTAVYFKDPRWPLCVMIVFNGHKSLAEIYRTNVPLLMEIPAAIRRVVEHIEKQHPGLYISTGPMQLGGRQGPHLYLPIIATEKPTE
jgi:hypothetical protein